LKCSATNKQKRSVGQKMKNLKEEKCLIAHFSREGNNYVSGKIVNLPVGNTKVVAEMIREMTEGDVFRIDTVKSYPEDYTETTNVAKNELHDNSRPELSSHVENMDSYNVIFLGYPNWWERCRCRCLRSWKNMIFLIKLLFHFVHMKEAD